MVEKETTQNNLAELFYIFNLMGTIVFFFKVTDLIEGSKIIIYMYKGKVRNCGLILLFYKYSYNSSTAWSPQIRKNLIYPSYLFVWRTPFLLTWDPVDGESKAFDEYRRFWANAALECLRMGNPAIGVLGALPGELAHVDPKAFIVPERRLWPGAFSTLSDSLLWPNAAETLK